MLKAFLIFTVASASALANVPKNLGSAINKNNPEYVEKYLRNGQSPNNFADWGFGDSYLVKALKNVEKFKKDAAKRTDAQKIVNLMLQFDAEGAARNEALRSIVDAENYDWLRPLVAMGANVNYYVCQDLGFGLGKNKPWTILDITAHNLGNNAFPNSSHFTLKAIQFLESQGAHWGEEITNDCPN